MWAKEVKNANFTVEAYVGTATDGFHQTVRTIGAALACQPDRDLLKFNNDTWNSFTQDAYKPKQDKEVEPKVKEVIAAVRGLDLLSKAALVKTA